MAGRDIDYRKFSNRVCNWREAGFIGIGFAVAVGIVAAILLGIYFGTKCPEGQSPCNDGSCKPNSDFCNGVPNCPIGDDEWKCYPTEFYVSFRTNNSYSEDLASNTSEAFLQKQAIFQDAIKAAITNGNEIRNVTVFRFRGVDERSWDGAGRDLAVDSFIKLGPGGRKEEDPLPGYLNQTEIADLISNQLTQFHASFSPQGANVTTGVGVVLRAPENSGCGKKAVVYCPNHCDKDSFFQYGSTKGCPECVCGKLNPA